MEKLGTTDLCDEHMDFVASGELRVLPPSFQAYGKRRQFAGPVSTVKVFEDNVLVRKALEQDGRGRVLIVDGGGSLRCALLGGNLAVLGEKNGWSGVIVNGCVRDVNEINSCDIGVRALASHPLKSIKKGEGSEDAVVFVGGVRIHPGEWCYADDDGVIISSMKLSKL
ncbi:hypothetical protein KP509_04G044800 [Ceratopteris richardii]|uniref:4-hydroxy-4-methyl-2-oxoglutarate aldolase n=1 Tax=Ceratopteris richardii TaxID=49495 RepID=A0A8T2UWI2_CERRI|nr:hypothetical protein KP509_04G044800 [Ceratopteris richardii]